MPAIVPPAASSIPQGTRVSAHFQYQVGEVQNVSIMGTTFNDMGVFHLDPRSIQVPASFKTIKAVQFALVQQGELATTLEPAGIFYIVVDSLQVFAFQIMGNPDVGWTSITATIPVESTSQSLVDFMYFFPVAGFAGQVLADLYVNCFDFAVPPFFAGSQVISAHAVT